MVKPPRALFETGMACCSAVLPSSPLVLAAATFSAVQFRLLLAQAGCAGGHVSSVL